MGLLGLKKSRPIAVRNPYSPVFEREDIRERRVVLRFLSKERRCVAAGGLVYDPVQKRHIRENDLAYIEGDWGWTTADLYLFRLYGLKLDPEFVEYVLGTEGD